MTASTRKRMLHGFSRLFALAPFVLGFIRYFSRAHDPRVLWLAAASFVGAALTLVVAKARDRDASRVPAMAVIIGVVSALAAVLAAWLLWSLVSVGVIMFAVVFGISWAVSYILALRARAEPGAP